jgi:hypothetical protein
VAGFIQSAIVAGIFATIVLDIWQRLLQAVAGIPATNWSNEAVIGWTMHYLIGVIYGLVYLGLIVIFLSGTPSLLNGFLFGLASVVVPWFVMQPALGLGIMGSKAPNPNVPRFTALGAHCLYGTALFVGSVLSGFPAV